MPTRSSSWVFFPSVVFALSASVIACSATNNQETTGTTTTAAGGQGGTAGSTGGQNVGGLASGGGGGGPACVPCSEDLTQVIDCDGNVVETCPAEELCAQGQCKPACEAASVNKSSVGCDYHAVTLNAIGQGFGGCFVAFIANTWASPVHIEASWDGAPIDLSLHAAIPQGSGPMVSYTPYDPIGGLPAGDVAILFLANDPVPHGTWAAPAACPVPAAVGLDAHVHLGVSLNTGRSKSFHITTDKPVVAYQMLPYQAAFSTTTGATLLLPVSAWDTNYIAVEAGRWAYAGGAMIPPSMSLVASEDGTQVTMLPKIDIKPGILVDGATANTPVTYTLNAGETIEFIEFDELTGSPIQSNKPIGVFAGHLGLRVPYDADYSDHAEQQLPPVRAMGSVYAVASYRDRQDGVPENRRHRIVGAVDGTLLTFDPPIAGAPTTLDLGSVVELQTDTPFVVKSQDDDHPFMVFTYMSGSAPLGDNGGKPGYGDSEFVRIIAGPQYLKRYVFFTDPTYPETNLVVVRKKGENGFADVALDCAGTLGGWTPIGSGGTYQYTRVDLSRHNFEAQGACNNGRHEMVSNEPFGLWVWGWGSPETRPGEDMPCDNTKPNNSCDVSYAYPAGENVKAINTVTVLPEPK